MTQHVSIAALNDYIERKGGPVHAFTGIGIRTYDEDDELVLDQTPEERLRYERARNKVKNWNRPARNGLVPYFAADEFAIDMLGVHPADVWPEWYAIEAPTLAEIREAEVEEALADLASELEDEETRRLARVAA